MPTFLDPELEDFLGGEMHPLSTEGGDGFQWSSMPAPSLENSSEWVTWQANLVNTPTWWPELSVVPGEMDLEEFARKVQALSELPKRRSHAQGTTNDYSTPLAPQTLEHDQFLPISSIKFSGQDYHMWQLQKTLVYAKALQYWAEKAQPPHPGKPYKLAESAQELCQVMEPLDTFMGVEVLEDHLSSNWQMIIPSRKTELAQPDEGNQRDRSHSRNQRAHARGAFTAAHSMGHSKPTVTTQAASPLPAPT